jgi:hypothetical protein
MALALVPLLLAAGYLLFAGQVSGTEALAGLGAVLVAGAYAFALHRCAARPIGLRAPWGRLLGSVGVGLVVDSGRVAAMIARGGSGAWRRQKFRPGGDEADDSGRRALVTLALSVAPNAYVARVSPDHLLLHELAPRSPRPDETWPL